jgi:aldose 1-epimerase
MRPLRISGDDVELIVLPEVGGRIHRLRAFGADVIRAPDDPAEHARDPFYWGSYPMLPWCGRLDVGRLTVADREVDLAANHPDGWAIHGQAYAAPWEVVDEGTLRFRGGGDAWPWRYEAELTYGLNGNSVRVGLTLTNADDSPMPAGVGLHPWFAGPPLLRIPAGLAYDDNTISSPEPRPVAGDYDLQSLSEMAGGMDSTWTGLTDRRVQLAWPGQQVRCEMVASANGNLVFVAARPPDIDAIALEPQTHAPQGLRRLIRDERDPMTLLAPGATLGLEMTLSFSR